MTTIEVRVPGKPDPIEIQVPSEEDFFSSYMAETGAIYNYDLIQWLRDNYPIHSSIVDVGAHIGTFTRACEESLVCDRIYAFEPSPGNIECFNANSVDPETVLIEKAVGDSPRDEVTLVNLAKNNSGMKRVSNSDEYEGHKVSMDSLDNWLGHNFLQPYESISLLKIDVEGFEPHVMAGATRLIKTFRPLIITETEETLESFWAQYTYLKKFGYDLVTIINPQSRVCVFAPKI